jgi:hypothetical protein
MLEMPGQNKVSCWFPAETVFAPAKLLDKTINEDATQLAPLFLLFLLLQDSLQLLSLFHL